MIDDVLERRKELIRWRLKEKDRNTLEERVDRWVSVESYYSEYTEVLVDYFYEEAFDLFVQGHFVGTILLCDFLIEVILNAQKERKGESISAVIERVLNEDQKQNIAWLRALRNGIAHGDPRTLAEHERHPKGQYDTPLSDSEQIDATYGYLKGNRGLEEDAHRSLRCALELIKQFYRTQ